MQGKDTDGDVASSPVSCYPAVSTCVPHSFCIIVCQPTCVCSLAVKKSFGLVALYNTAHEFPCSLFEVYLKLQCHNIYLHIITGRYNRIMK